MNILQALKQLRDDIKTWVTNNLNALNAKIDEKTISIDSELSSTSTNPVQNKAIKKAIDDIPTFSGDYNDLTNAPNISEDGSGSMTIADESGNIILKVDATGLQTTDVKIDNTSLKSKISSWDNKSDFSGDYNDLTNAPDISEDGSGNMIIADESGNIIFKADADGVHTTAISINGEAAATESYVDNAITNIEFPTTDLTGYATETYVDNKVADLVNSAPEALDTLGELAIALENHEDAYDALLETVGSKATHTDLENLREELSKSIVAESDEWKIVDEAGHIIFSVDADGAHTTSMTLNGQSIKDMIDNKVDKVDGKGLSTNDFTNEYKNKLDNLDDIVIEESDPTVPAWAKEPNKPSYTASEIGALADTTVLADLTDDATHRTVTDAEKQAWNAKSDFSGDYNDLDNAPNITEDDSKSVVYADESGNVVAKVDANGLETTAVTANSIVINGTDVKSALDDIAGKADKTYVDEKTKTLTDDEFIAWLNEENIVTPIASASGEIYTSNNNEIYIL